MLLYMLMTQELFIASTDKLKETRNEELKAVEDCVTDNKLVLNVTTWVLRMFLSKKTKLFDIMVDCKLT